jgi:predicted transcriptional regulator
VERDRAFDLVLGFFKALADESRLRIVGLLAAGGERSVDELAAVLELRAPTVSHHLARLRALGLVSMRAEGNVHLYRLEADALRDLSRQVLALDQITALARDVDAEAWQQKVLRDFFEGERLKEIPASRKKREVVLRWLASQFPMDVRYREVEVNELLRRYHPDTATLRRELVGAGLLQRERSVYWRSTPAQPSSPQTAAPAPTEASQHQAAP